MLIPNRRVHTFNPGLTVFTAFTAGLGSGSLLTDMVSYWSLEEASGTRIDAHASNNLTANGTVGRIAAKVNYGADFTAGNVWLSHVHNAELSLFNESFTVAAWVYMKNYAQYHQWFDKRNNIGGNSGFSLFYTNYGGGDAMSMAVFNAGSGASCSTTVHPAEGTWYYLVGWLDYDSSEVGIQLDNGTPDTAACAIGINGTAGNFVLGRYDPGAGSYVNGYMDEAGFWKRVLTSDERTWLYNGGSGRSYAEIVAF